MVQVHNLDNFLPKLLSPLGAAACFKGLAQLADVDRAISIDV